MISFADCQVMVFTTISYWVPFKKAMSISMGLMFLIKWNIVQHKIFRILLVYKYSCYIGVCHVKYFSTLWVSMGVVLYQSTSILFVFMVLPRKTWAEDKIMSTQVKLQQEEVAWFNMFKTKCYIKML